MQNSEIDPNEKSTLIKAFWSAFPSPDSFKYFKEKDREVSKRAIPKIIKYAYKKGIIQKDTEKAFVEFLEANKKADINKPLPQELTFADVIETLSGNISVNSLISQMEITNKELSLPIIKATMITRLKKNFIINTAKKRTLLRVLAFKLAEKRPELNWHYEMLCKIVVGAPPKDNIKETAGVTITLHLQSKGEIITPADINWLKNEIPKCIEYLNLASYVNKKTVVSSGASSFSLMLPKKQGPIRQPRLYDKAIRDALALAHQMAARWFLYEYSGTQKHLVIIIHAGLASEANLITQPLLETKLAGETHIHLTDFSYLCARMAEVEAGFECYNERPNTSDVYSGNIWTVKYFWSYNYYDFIPYLLEERMLPISTNDPAYESFQKALYLPEQGAETTFDALQAMHHFPHNSILLIEIANVLRARQMIDEADEVLANLLLFDPEHIVARVMRMIIYSNIAQAQNDFLTSEMAFERAVSEGEFITSSHITDCNIWSEFGAVYFNRAKKMIKCLREGNLPKGKMIKRDDVLASLNKARACFLKSLATSPTGKDTSAIFWLIYILCFIELFSADETLLNKSNNIMVVDSNNVFNKVSLRMFKTLGWLREDIPPDGKISESSFNNLLITLSRINAQHDNSMLSRNYIPYARFLFAIFLWDFTPYFTAEIYNTVLYLLNEARRETEKLIPDNICVYKICQNFVTPAEFLGHIKETEDLIKKLVTRDNFKQWDGLYLNPEKQKELSNIKLMLLELTRY